MVDRARRRGFGRVKVSYASPVTATEHNYITGPGQALVVPAAEGALSGASGPDGLPLTISLFVPPPFGSVELQSDGSFTYTPPPGHLGGDYFDFLVMDPAGSYAVGRVMVEIAAPPSASCGALPLCHDGTQSKYRHQGSVSSDPFSC